MDWNQVNFNTPSDQYPWSARTAKTGTTQNPVAYEWQIDLCNRVQADYWVNLPAECLQDPDYVTNLATLIYNNLNANLKVYIEYANEVWWESASNPYCASHASSVGLSSYDQYYVYVSVKIWDGFESVFGKNSPRLVKVLAGQGGNTGLITTHLNDLKNITVNPNGATMNAYAVADYFNPGDGSDGWNHAVNVASAAAQTLGVIPLVFYEGGYNGQTPDAQAYTDYTNLLAGLDKYLSGPFCHYTQTGYNWSWYWGAKGKTSDSNTLAVSPKYYALSQWAQAHPKPQTAIAPQQRMKTPVAAFAATVLSIVKDKDAVYGIDGRRIGNAQLRTTRGLRIKRVASGAWLLQL
jgi:hypothetical protein